jgi:hypothetical protein
VISYSKDAYTSMPLSEKSALNYIYNNNLIDTKNGKYIIPEYQITHSYRFNNLPQNPDNIYIFRMTGYYYYSMRIDLSFTDNKHLKEKEAVINSNDYNNVYTNRTTSIYTRR